MSRAYKGTIPALQPGVKIGTGFEICEQGRAPFIAARLAMFEKLRAEKAGSIKESVEIDILLPSGDIFKGMSNVTKPLDVVSKFKIPGIQVARVKFEDRELNSMCSVKDIEESDDDDLGCCDDDKGLLWDLTRPLPGSCSLKLYKFEDEEGRFTFWHSSAHLLGLCIEQLYGAQVTIGPALDTGFYYDFYGGDAIKICDEDYEKIEACAAAIRDQDAPFERLDVTKDEALMLFADNPFKLALINAKVDAATSVYRCGPFIDLCLGPHVPSLKVIREFKIEKHSATYWLGDANGDSLQRVYGVSFPDKGLLKQHIARCAEAKLRDHRILGTQLNYFFFEPDYSPGCAFWTPSGSRIYSKLCDFMRSEYVYRGFTEVNTPNLFTSDLFKVSGHWQNYRDSMFTMTVEGKDWALKPMNCPSHCCIFKHMNLSYRQLPIRLADFGVLHRNEFSGSLGGLTRVRRFQQDDAHIFCELSQVGKEVSDALEFLFFVYEVFGFTFQLYLSTRPKKALGDITLWNAAEDQLTKSLDACGLPWKYNRGDGAFYGPKIDIQLFDAMGRGHQCGTIQLDFQLPLRFDLQYRGPNSEIDQSAINAKSEAAAARQCDADPAHGECPPNSVSDSLETPLKPGNMRPVMIHRAILGSIERMTAIVLEHYAGKLPFWLSPRQVMVCPVTDKHLEYAYYVHNVLKTRGFDAEVDSSSTTLNKKIRTAQVAKWNYILVIGAREEDNQTVTIRSRDDPNAQITVGVQEMLDKFAEEKDIGKRKIAGLEPYVKMD